MGWRDVIGAVLDATAAAPARQARRTTSANKETGAPALRVQASAARSRPTKLTPAAPATGLMVRTARTVASHCRAAVGFYASQCQ